MNIISMKGKVSKSGNSPLVIVFGNLKSSIFCPIFSIIENLNKIIDYKSEIVNNLLMKNTRGDGGLTLASSDTISKYNGYFLLDHLGMDHLLPNTYDRAEQSRANVKIRIESLAIHIRNI